jgi:predicted AlkP superfamily phosphohydrolase/phosphomutase
MPHTGRDAFSSHKRVRPRPVVVIGFDGATFEILDRLVGAGRMPTFKHLIDTGAHGTLTTTIPPITASAWTSFSTGKNPGKHGLIDFVVPRDSAYDVWPINSSDRQAKALWELASEQGLKVGIIGVPITYPPEEVNGFMVSDFTTPSQSSEYTYPQSLKAELNELVGQFPLIASDKASSGSVEEFLQDLRSGEEARHKAALHLLVTKEWDLFVFIFYITDMVQHTLMDIINDSHLHHDASRAERYGDMIWDLYTFLDSRLAEFVAALPEDAILLIMSDHGHGPAYFHLHVNTWLHRMGLLRFKTDALTRLKHMMFRVGFAPLNMFRIAQRLGLGFLRGKVRHGRGRPFMKRLFLSLADVDWHTTKAFSVGSFGQIYVNLTERWEHGSVDRDEYEEVLQTIERAAQSLEDPDLKRPVIESVYRRGDLFSGPFVDSMPDLVLSSTNLEYLCFGHSDFGANSVLTPIIGMTGHHRMNGILMAWGQGVQSGRKLQCARIVDVAPTILYAMGLGVPKDMDGRVLTDVFTEDFLKSNPLRIDESSSLRFPEDFRTAEQDAELVKRRLEGLGYVT